VQTLRRLGGEDQAQAVLAGLRDQHQVAARTRGWSNPRGQPLGLVHHQ
jgi:hypothetical protein